MDQDWEKILWRRQPYPDNHVPQKLFLASLRRNPNLRVYAYWPLVILSCSIAQHLAVILVFLAVFVRLYDRSLDPRTLVCISVLCFLVGYVTWNALGPQQETFENSIAKHLKAVKSSIMMFLALVSLSPVLRTLTAATSSDSIWALSAVLFILNALLADYTANKPNDTHEGLFSVLSMNAAVSASVVLASRLSTNLSVFALMLFSIQSFSLFPMLRHRLQSSSVGVWLLITIALGFSCIWLLASLSQKIAWLSSVIFVSVTLIAPAMLIWAQRHKNIIRGPWDPAVPKVY